MFLFKASRYLEELECFRPDILQACRVSLEEATKDLHFTRINRKAFAACSEESVNYAVMEKTSSAAVVPMGAGWSDIGSWCALWDVSGKDDSGNAVTGDVIQQNSSGRLVWSDHRLVATVGVEDLVIVGTKDAVGCPQRSGPGC